MHHHEHQPVVSFELSKGAEDRNREVDFQDIPVDAYCPFCRAEVVTVVEYRSSWLTWVWCIILFFLLGWISFCVLPFIWPLLQDSCHFCSQCTNQLSRKHRASCPRVSSDVVTARCGSCAVVVSLQWALLLVVMLLCIAGAYTARYYVKFIGLPDIPRGPVSDLAWKDYLAQCGVRSYLGNPLHAAYAFEHQYRHQTVAWEGRVMRVSEGFFSKHFLYLRMTPPQYPGPVGLDRPDLGLIFDTALSDQVAMVTVGDAVKFDATLLTLAKRGQPHYGLLWEFTITAKNEELPSMDRGMFYLGNMGFAPVRAIPDLARRAMRPGGGGTNKNPLMVEAPVHAVHHVHRDANQAVGHDIPDAHDDQRQGRGEAAGDDGDGG
eukprot:Selendium_serpulae@DN3815_c0_g2_i1.p1